jgi:hypothetical protein
VKKIPWGVIAGSCGIFIFYDSLAITILYIVFKQIMAQTTQEATLFDTWYQTLMFILDIIVVLVLVVSLIFYFLKKEKKNNKKEALVK